MAAITVELAGIGVRIAGDASPLLEEFAHAARVSAGGGASGAADMEIVMETAAEVRPGQGLQVNCGGGETRFSMSGVECGFAPATGEGRLLIVPDATVLEYALKIVCSTLLVESGGGMFHAACVSRNGGGYVFAGPHGAGKTTIAKAVAAAGSTDVLDDENAAVRRGPDGTYYLYPVPAWAASGNKARPGSSGALGKAARKTELAACFVIAHGDETEIETAAPAGRAMDLFENMIYLLPEKTILESAVRFCGELQRDVRSARLRIALKDMERLWDVIDGYEAAEI